MKLHRRLHVPVLFGRIVSSAFFVVLPAPAIAADCQAKIIDTVPLVVRGGHYEINVLINGRVVALMADTGAQRTVVTSATADKFNLPREFNHNSIIVSLNGRGNPQQDVTVARLSIGKFAAANLHVLVDGEDSVTPDYEGILGADILLRNDVQFDFPDRLLTFYAPSSCRADVTELKLPYLSMPAERSDVTGRMLMHVALNGHPINAVLDTGSTQTIVTREAALKSGAAATQLESGKAMPNTDANGIGPSTHQVSFATVDIGRERFHNIKMNVANARFGEVDALVGLDYLRRRVVRLSAARGRIYILQPSHVIPPLRMSQTAAQ